MEDRKKATNLNLGRWTHQDKS